MFQIMLNKLIGYIAM